VQLKAVPIQAGEKGKKSQASQNMEDSAKLTIVKNLVFVVTISTTNSSKIFPNNHAPDVAGASHIVIVTALSRTHKAGSRYEGMSFLCARIAIG
jgi:hypothetical protein